ncbi:MAG: hypothetical protein K6F87_04580 [Lachnospiraceae bacterium]|nr:hypothetical protein [Lachnospiraceae bacterium]
MGDIIRLECNECGKSYDLNIGRGMADNSLDRVLGHFDESTSDLIRSKLSVIDKEDYWGYRRMIGRCGSCGTFAAIPVFVINGDGKEYLTAQKCECGASYEIYDDDDDARMKEIRCPKCNGTMSALYTGMWD